MYPRNMPDKAFLSSKILQKIMNATSFPVHNDKNTVFNKILKSRDPISAIENVTDQVNGIVWKNYREKDSVKTGYLVNDRVQRDQISTVQAT